MQSHGASSHSRRPLFTIVHMNNPSMLEHWLTRILCYKNLGLDDFSNAYHQSLLTQHAMKLNNWVKAL